MFILCFYNNYHKISDSHEHIAFTLYFLWGSLFGLDLFWSPKPKFDYVISTTRPLNGRAHRQNFAQLLNCTQGKCFINAADLAVSQLTNASSMQNQSTYFVLTKHFSETCVQHQWKSIRILHSTIKHFLDISWILQHCYFTTCTF